MLDQLVKVDRQQLEDKTEVLSMYEGIFESEDVVVVILVHATVEL